MATGLPKGMDDSNVEWVLDFCNFRTAWSLPTEGKGKQLGEGIVVAHPDTGFTRHPELIEDGRYLINEARSFLDVRWTFLSGLDPEPVSTDDNRPTAEDSLAGFSLFLHPSHGTGTASVLMSSKGPSRFLDPRFYVSGVAPKVKVIPMRVTRSVVLWDIDESALAQAIYTAINSERDVAVISISLGAVTRSGRGSKLLRKALKEAKENGIVVCASAGQLKCIGRIANAFDSPISPAFPGNDPNAICAAGCNFKHEKIPYGSYRKEVDITAPGVNIWRALSQHDSFDVNKSEGTSYSAPIVAGACALWQAYHGREHLKRMYGKGRLFDVFKMVLKKIL